MSDRDKKIRVLHQLSLESEPVSIQQLLSKIGEGFSERTVRRWLSQMVKEGLVGRFGQKRGTTYAVIQRAHRRTGSAASCFSEQSKATIEQVRRPLYERPPVPYHDQWLDSYQPNISFYIPPDMRAQLHAAGKRSQDQEPAGTYAHQIFQRLLIDLSYNSSRLEGNTYSLLETQRLVLEGTEAVGKLDEERIMILNHKEAIRYLVDNAYRLEVSTQTICTLHYLLSDGLVEDRFCGKVRDHGVRIGGSTYHPFERANQLKERLDRITHKAALITDPYEQSFFLLVHTTYLQGFSDVNKRTARLSANIPLITHNLVPLSFNDVEREDYTSAVIAIYELQELGPMLELYLFSYMRTCIMFDATIKAFGYDEIRVRYRQQRRALIRQAVLEKLVGPQLIAYVTAEAASHIPELHRSKFIEDALEDLRNIDQSRLAGLGLTPDELQAWIEAIPNRGLEPN